MIKLFKFSLVILFMGYITGCSNDSIELDKNVEKELNTELFSVTPVAKSDYSKVYSSIKGWDSDNSASVKTKSTNDDLIKDISIINVSYLPETEIIFTESDIEEYQYVAYLKDKQGEIYSQFYLNVTSDDTYYSLDYYPISNEAFSIKINKFDGTLVNQTTKVAAASAGQRTMDCITDAYSNHGWVSVWVTVQSIFIPMTGVAIAAACAGGNIV